MNKFLSCSCFSSAGYRSESLCPGTLCSLGKHLAKRTTSQPRGSSCFEIFTFSHFLFPPLPPLMPLGYIKALNNCQKLLVPARQSSALSSNLRGRGRKVQGHPELTQQVSSHRISITLPLRTPFFLQVFPFFQFKPQPLLRNLSFLL